MMPNNYRVGEFILVAYDRKPTQLSLTDKGYITGKSGTRTSSDEWFQGLQ